jgi:hypothetical protein
MFTCLNPVYLSRTSSKWFNAKTEIINCYKDPNTLVQMVNLLASSVGDLVRSPSSSWVKQKTTRGSAHWACVAHLSFCFEETLYRTFHGASYQVSVHLAKRFREEYLFRNRPIRNKNCLWWPCLLTDRNLMSNLYGGPSIDTSYQVSIHLAMRFQRRRLKCEKLTDDRCQVMTKAHIAIGKVS